MRKVIVIMCLSIGFLIASPMIVYAQQVQCGWFDLFCSADQRKAVEAEQATEQQRIDAQKVQAIRQYDAQQQALQAVTDQKRLEYGVFNSAIQAQAQIAVEGIHQAGDTERYRLQAAMWIGMVRTGAGVVIVVAILLLTWRFAPWLIVRNYQPPVRQLPGSQPGQWQVIDASQSIAYIPTRKGEVVRHER